MRKEKKIYLAIFISILFIVSIIGGYLIYKNMSQKTVLIETNYGNIKIELDVERAPITTENFLNYVNSGFYSNTIFHRVIDGFMIQGGGYDLNGRQKQTSSPIKLESQNGLKNDRGTVAMARTLDPNSATSQFFINLQNNDFLNYGVRDDGYAVFGKVIEGMDIVDKIAKVQTNSNDQPLQEIKIIKATVI